MNTTIQTVTVERRGKLVLSVPMAQPATREEVRRAFLSLHLPRAFSLKVEGTAALVTIL